MGKKRVIMTFSWMLVIAWMGLIYYLSAQTGDDSGTLSEFFVGIALKLIKAFSDKQITDVFLLHHYVRKTAHFCIYMVFGFLMTNAFNRSGFSRKILWIAAIICIVYAASDEVHQMFVPGRGPDAMDVIIDGSGALLGCIIYGVTNHLLRTILVPTPILVQQSVLKPVIVQAANPEFKIAQKSKVEKVVIETPTFEQNPKPHKVKSGGLEQSNRKYISWLMVIIWMGIIFWFTTETLRALKYAIEISAGFMQEMVSVALDKEVGPTLITRFISEMFYIGLFTMLGLLVYNALIKIRIRHSTLLLFFITIAICSVYAISDEVHQIFIIGANSSPKDVVMDTFGAMFGCLIFSAFKRAE
jgi:VanZ family protein